MPTTTRTIPACTAPPPGDPRCGWCDAGVVWDDDFGEVACPGCGGTGGGAWVAPCELTLAPTHTFPKPGLRRAVYDPNSRRLTLTRGKKTRTYAVREFAVDGEYGRGFELEKPDGEVYHLSVGPAGVTCSCGGDAYQSNAKANRRAAEDGRDVYPSFGCVHADSVVPLVRAGWFGPGPVS